MNTRQGKSKQGDLYVEYSYGAVFIKMSYMLEV